MKLLVAVLVLLGLLIAGDRVAEQVAEHLLAGRLEGELSVRPSVEVGGFPFLTQAVRGRYDEVHVSAAEVDRGRVTLKHLEVTLANARVPLSDLVHGSVSAVPVDRLTASALLPYDALAAAAGRGLTLGPDPEGVRVSGTVRVLGEDVKASAVSKVQLEGDTVVLRARRVEVGGAQAGGAVAKALAGRLDLRVPLPALPYGIELSTVQAGPQGVTVSGGARHVVLHQ